LIKLTILEVIVYLLVKLQIKIYACYQENIKRNARMLTYLFSSGYIKSLLIIIEKANSLKKKKKKKFFFYF